MKHQSLYFSNLKLFWQKIYPKFRENRIFLSKITIFRVNFWPLFDTKSWFLTIFHSIFVKNKIRFEKYRFRRFFCTKLNSKYLIPKSLYGGSTFWNFAYFDKILKKFQNVEAPYDPHRIGHPKFSLVQMKHQSLYFSNLKLFWQKIYPKFRENRIFLWKITIFRDNFWPFFDTKSWFLTIFHSIFVKNKNRFEKYRFRRFICTKLNAKKPNQKASYEGSTFWNFKMTKKCPKIDFIKFENVGLAYGNFWSRYLAFSLVQKKRRNLYFSNLILLFTKMEWKMVKNHDLVSKSGQKLTRKMVIFDRKIRFSRNFGYIFSQSN